MTEDTEENAPEQRRVQAICDHVARVNEAFGPPGVISETGGEHFKQGSMFNTY